LLCIHSKYFNEIISETEKLKNQLKIATDNIKIPLLEKIPTNFKSEINIDDEMNLILKYIYNNGDFTNILKEITPTNCLEILSLSKSLGIDKLSECLISFIIKNILTKENCLKLYIDSIKVNIYFIYFKK